MNSLCKLWECLPTADCPLVRLATSSESLILYESATTHGLEIVVSSGFR